MEAFSPEGRVRKWLFGGGQLLWNSKSQGEGKPTLKGLKDILPILAFPVGAAVIGAIILAIMKMIA